MISEREAPRSVDRPLTPEQPDMNDIEALRIDAQLAVHRYRAEKRKVNNERSR